jgi:LysR family hydrogen peroxide-inducible transcriptional activator
LILSINMTLQELRYLTALAEIGHFGEAAKACHVTQSTLSTQLKKLEEYLGVTLFDRSLKQVVPTPIGRQIFVSARLIVAEAEKIRALARYAQDPWVLTLTLGVIPTLGPYYLPHILPILQRVYPKLRLLLQEQTTSLLLEQVRDGRLDLALLALPVHDQGLESAPLFSEPFRAALPVGHALAVKTEISLPELVEARLLLLEEGHCLRDQALAVCRLNRAYDEEVRATSLETLRQMVGMGIGVTLLPSLAAVPPWRDACRAVEIRPVNAPEPSRTIGLVWRKRFSHANVVLSLVQTLRDHLPEGVTVTD